MDFSDIDKQAEIDYMKIISSILKIRTVNKNSKTVV